MTSESAAVRTAEDAGEVVRIGRCELDLVPWRWAMADERRDEIDALWQRQSDANPGYFDGIVVLAAETVVSGGALTGSVFATRFRNYLYWREIGYADTSVTDAFGSALIRSRDGGVLLARQRAGNINSGRVYLPGGFVDERDVGVGGRIDIVGSIAREVAEETGLDASAMARADGLVVTRVGVHLSIAATWQSELPADALRERVAAHLARDPRSELESVLVAGSMRELAGLPLVHYCRRLLPVLLD